MMQIQQQNVMMWTMTYSSGECIRPGIQEVHTHFRLDGTLFSDASQDYVRGRTVAKNEGA
jgi:hypothetical protein